MKNSNSTRSKRETATMLAATLACYLTAAACVLTISYTLATFAAHDLGRQVVAAVAPQDF